MVLQDAGWPPVKMADPCNRSNQSHDVSSLITRLVTLKQEHDYSITQDLQFHRSLMKYHHGSRPGGLPLQPSIVLTDKIAMKVDNGCTAFSDRPLLEEAPVEDAPVAKT